LSVQVPASRTPSALSSVQFPSDISEVSFVPESVAESHSGFCEENNDAVAEAVADNTVEFGFSDIIDLEGGEIFSQLSNDPDLKKMLEENDSAEATKLAEQPEIAEPVESDTPFSTEVENDLDLLMTESEYEDSDGEDVDDEEIDGLDEEETSAEVDHADEQQPKRVRHRLQTGRRAYGDLDDAEQGQLIDEIVGQGKGPSDANKLRRALDGLGILTRGTGPGVDKKRIPEIYLKNSRSVRLAVLAGFIDTDGWYVYPENMLAFAQSETWHKELFWDAVALARSLGLGVWTKKRIMWDPKRTKRIPMLFAQIFGNVAEVPCLLARKKAVERLIPQSHSFKILDISLRPEATEWAGFRVDKDQLYLRHDYLVLHNSGFEEFVSPLSPFFFPMVIRLHGPHSWLFTCILTLLTGF
jgi:pre-mRNA-processing factor 8